jgi:hypothetical protein
VNGTDSPYLVQECPHARCDARVIAVRLGKKLEHKLVDAEPATWEVGARIRIASVQADVNRPVAYRLLGAGRAFGLARIYRLHDETCKGQQRRARQRSTSS